MRFVRSLLALLVVLGLAITPVAARAAVAMPQLPHQVAAKSDIASMLDCHRAMGEKAAYREPARHAMGEDTAGGHTGDHKNCPDCAKSNPCAADLCQLKCFKVLGFVPSFSKVTSVVALAYDALALSDSDPIDWKPRTPPPRS